MAPTATVELAHLPSDELVQEISREESSDKPDQDRIAECKRILDERTTAELAKEDSQAEVIEALQAKKAELAGIEDREYTDDEKALLKQIVHALNSGKSEKIEAAYAATQIAAETPAEKLKTATQPDRPEGAADDETISQAEREATAEFDVTPEQHAANEAKVAAQPDPPDAAAALNDPEFRERLQEASGIAADQAEARGEIQSELDGYVPGQEGAEPAGLESTGTDVEPAGEEATGIVVADAYDAKVWQAIVGGPQPDVRKVQIKSVAGLVIGAPEGGFKSGQEYEIRATVLATGYGSDLKLKRNKETDELEQGDVEEKRVLTVTDAWIVETD
jgi:hypothetical protein